MRNGRIRRIAMGGVLGAIIILLTALVSIPMPMPGGQGYLNLGDAGVLSAAFLLGGPWGAVCAGVSSALADVLLGFAVYAPATLFIKGGAALLAGALLRQVKPKHAFLAFLPAALLVPAGYFAYETLLFGLAAALVGVPMNLLQCVVGVLVAQAIVLLVEKTGVNKF